MALFAQIDQNEPQEIEKNETFKGSYKSFIV